MSQTRMYTPTKLWSAVQDMMAYWGEEDERFSECHLLQGAIKTSYILQVPKGLIEFVEEKLDDIEDALEQLLWEHQVDVYVMVREEVEEAKLSEELPTPAN